MRLTIRDLQFALPVQSISLNLLEITRKNWSGETKTLTTFARGTYHTFDSGITTDATLLPGSIGAFELYVPHAFGSFIGYSYVIDWEEYE